MQTFAQKASRAVKFSIIESCQPLLTQDLADYVEMYFDSNDIAKTDDVLAALKGYILEDWEEKKSIECLRDIPTWYAEDSTRLIYAEEALIDMGDRGRILTAMRLGYANYLSQTISSSYYGNMATYFN